jgi:hypothetical protein
VIEPPGIKEQLRNQTRHDNERESAAGDAFDCVRPERATAERIGQSQFAPGENVHHRNSNGAYGRIKINFQEYLLVQTARESEAQLPEAFEGGGCG